MRLSFNSERRIQHKDAKSRLLFTAHEAIAESVTDGLERDYAAFKLESSSVVIYASVLQQITAEGESKRMQNWVYYIILNTVQTLTVNLASRYYRPNLKQLAMKKVMITFTNDDE